MNDARDARAVCNELLDALHEVDDPDTGVNLVDLGLIYGVDWAPGAGTASVRMTLTSPACPAGAIMVEGIERRLSRVEGVVDVRVEVTFDPPWTPDRVTEAGRAALGWR
jgi:metal-sulfur cluster biosynthetic enzyme